MSLLRELIPEYLLGTLPEAQRRELEAQLAGSPSLRAELDAAAEGLASQAARAVVEVTPPPSIRARLLATVASVDRFVPFFDDLSRLFELPVPTIRQLCACIDGQRSTFETTLLGVRLETAELFHFAVGPELRATGAAGGVLRVRAGATFPLHRHHGDEVTYVLEGGYIVDGRVFGPGSRIEMRTGTSHDYRSAPERDLVTMVLHRGITILADGARDR